MVEVSSRATEQRRFSSLIVAHPNLASHDQFVSVLDKSISGSELLDAPMGNWRGFRSEYVTHQSFYPEHILSSEGRERNGGFYHDIYVAEGQLNEKDRTPVLFIASPYVRLLYRLIGELERRLAGPALQYLSLDMPSIYKQFENGRSGMTATKVTLQMLNQPGLELVSLTGRNPLNSDLHESLKGVAAPYALRAEVVVGEEKVRVNIDRHGNLWWFQSDESKFQLTLAMLAALTESEVLRLSRHLPLDRVETIDESS